MTCARTGGIGSLTGKLLRHQGAKLALLYAPSEAEKVKPTINKVFEDSEGAATGIKAYECDIVSPDSVEAAFSAILNDNPAFPSILINAAGVVSLHSLESFPADDVLRHYMVNLYGPTLTGQAFAKIYMAAVKTAEIDGHKDSIPAGRIVNIASQAAHVALHHHGPYCASKAGLIGLTKCMASEWGGRGITANSISPGPVMTELGKKAWGDAKVRDEYLAAVPTGRFAEPLEVARIVEFLCLDGSQNINGADIRLDGGYTAK